jgi:hypothetical protein
MSSWMMIGTKWSSMSIGSSLELTAATFTKCSLDIFFPIKHGVHDMGDISYTLVLRQDRAQLKRAHTLLRHSQSAEHRTSNHQTT